MNDDEIEQLVRDAIDAWLAAEDGPAAHDWLTRRASYLRQRHQAPRPGRKSNDADDG
jgi:hypothetical protein